MSGMFSIDYICEVNNQNPEIMKKFLSFFVMILSANLLFAQPGGFWGPRSETVQVWPDGAPLQNDYGLHHRAMLHYG